MQRACFTSVLLVLVIAVNPASGEAYICIAEKSTGFKYERNQGWEEMKFVTDDKYIIRHPNNDERDYIARIYEETNLDWILSELGEKDIWPCEGDIDKGILDCKVLFEDFRFSAKYLRFINYNAGSYINFQSSDIDHEYRKPFTPYIQIGQCSRM